MKNIKYVQTKIGKIELQEENGYIIEININKETKQNRETQIKNNKILEETEKQLHRVIGASGKLVGYALGLEMKEQLLELEKSYK